MLNEKSKIIFGDEKKYRKEESPYEYEGYMQLSYRSVYVETTKGRVIGPVARMYVKRSNEYWNQSGSMTIDHYGLAASGTCYMPPGDFELVQVSNDAHTTRSAKKVIKQQLIAHLLEHIEQFTSVVDRHYGGCI